MKVTRYNINNQPDTSPIDKLKIVKLFFFLHGISALLPWNMLINANSYFVDFKLANPIDPLELYESLNSTTNLTGWTICNSQTNQSSDQTNCTDYRDQMYSDLQSTNKYSTLDNYRLNFLSYLSIASKVPNIFFQLINLLFNSKSKSYSCRITITFIAEIGLFLLTIALALANSSSWPEIFFWVTIATAVLFNIANGIFQSSIYGIAAKFPTNYTNYVTLGFSFSGTIVALFMIISLLLSPHPQIVAIYYFTFATAFMVVCLVNQIIISRNVFYRYYTQIADQEEQKLTKSSSVGTLESTVTPVTLSFADLANNNINNHQTNNGFSINHSVDLKDDNQTEQPLPYLHGLARYWFIFKSCWVQLLNSILIYAVSFAIFPSVQSAIMPVNDYIEEKFFAPIFCFLFFNTFATVGNIMAEWIGRPKPKFVIFWVLLRALFIPFFMMCNYLPNKRIWPVFIQSDLVYALGSATMALTSGYLSSLSLMYAPRSVPNSYSSTAAMMASASVIIGILVGVQCSIFLQEAVTMVQWPTSFSN